jgi:hypothetical protein
MSLPVSSPAINAGANPDTLPFDQRGSGFPRTNSGVTDIGSYEYENTYRQPPAAVLAPVLKSLEVSPRRPRKPVKDLRFSFDLSQAANVGLLVERKYGRAHNQQCRHTKPTSQRKKRCRIYHNVGTRSIQAAAGKGMLHFNAAKLTPGAYRATLTASNANGTSAPVRVLFYRPWW